MRKYHMPSHAHLMVEDGETVFAGQVLAKTRDEAAQTKHGRCGVRGGAERVEAGKRDESEVGEGLDGLVRRGGIGAGQDHLRVGGGGRGERWRRPAAWRGPARPGRGFRLGTGGWLGGGLSTPSGLLLGVGAMALYLVMENEGGLPARGRGVNRHDHRGDRLVGDTVGEERVGGGGGVAVRGEDRSLRFRGREGAGGGLA